MNDKEIILMNTVVHLFFVLGMSMEETAKLVKQETKLVELIVRLKVKLMTPVRE